MAAVLAFASAFLACAVELVEAATIVLAVGFARGWRPALGAAAAAVVRHPLARVPENALALAVGVMLTSFGVFWTVEGARVHWPGGDAMLPALVAAVAAVSSAAVASLRRTAGGEARRS